MLVVLFCLALWHEVHARDSIPEVAKTKGPPFFAFCMDTHDAKKRTLQQQAELLKELGYSGAGHLWLQDIPERLKTLDAVGLKLFQIYLRVDIAPNNKRPYDHRLKESLLLLKGRDVAIAILMNGRGKSDVEGDPRAVEIIRDIAEMASESGVRVVLYPHVNFWLERVEDAVRVAKKVDRPNVGIMFNLCHWLKLDEEKNMEPLLESVMPYLFFVSIHGADTAAEIRTGTGNWLQPLDSGSFDTLKLLKALQELGYDGPIGLQCYGIQGDARVHLERSILQWRRLCERLVQP